LSNVPCCHGELGVRTLVSVVIELLEIGDISVARVGKCVGSNVGDKALHYQVVLDLSVVQDALGEVSNRVVLHLIIETRRLVVINVELRGEHLELSLDYIARGDLG